MRKFLLSSSVFCVLSLSGVGVVFAATSTSNSSGLNGIGQQSVQTQNSTTTQNTTTNSTASSTSTPAKQSSQPPQPSTTSQSTTTSTATTKTTTPSSSSQGTSTSSQSNASAIAGMVSSLGVNAQASARAQQMVAPMAKLANLLFAVILAVTFILLFLVTAVDLLYIAVPPVRNFLTPGGIAPQGSDMGGGMGGGMGGFGGGFGGGYGGRYGGGGMMGGGTQQRSPSRFLTQLISDEAKYAVAQVTSVEQHSTPMGTMGGFGGGMGGFGGGFGGGMQQQQPVPPSMKSILLDYMKKRIVFFIAFGVCASLFSVTIFTSIGVHLGEFLLIKLTHINSTIPQK